MSKERKRASPVVVVVVVGWGGRAELKQKALEVFLLRHDILSRSVPARSVEGKQGKISGFPCSKKRVREREMLSTERKQIEQQPLLPARPALTWRRGATTAARLTAELLRANIVVV